MGYKKLLRFAELNTFPNVLQFPQEIKGNWNGHFKNKNPIVLELACGKGEYTLGLASLYPNKNFIGVDIKGNRLWVGAKKALAANLKNVAFVRGQIEQIVQYFSFWEVSEIWITFPDPQLRLSKAKKRLTHPRFLRLYKDILQPGGRIHLKTDSPNLYQFTKKVLRIYNCYIINDNENIYVHKGLLSKELQIKTHYESLDIAGSNKVHYLSFQLPNELANEKTDNILKEAIRYELD